MVLDTSHFPKVSSNNEVDVITTKQIQNILKQQLEVNSATVELTRQILSVCTSLHEFCKLISSRLDLLEAQEQRRQKENNDG